MSDLSCVVAQGTIGRVKGLGSRVHLALAKRGMGFNELDRALGRSEGYTSRLVSLDRNPRTDTLQALAKALRVRLDWLMSGEEPMDSEQGTASSAPKQAGLDEDVFAKAIAGAARGLPSPWDLTDRFAHRTVGIYLARLLDASEDAIRAVRTAPQYDADALAKEPFKWWTREIMRLTFEPELREKLRLESESAVERGQQAVRDLQNQRAPALPQEPPKQHAVATRAKKRRAS